MKLTIEKERMLRAMAIKLKGMLLLTFVATFETGSRSFFFLFFYASFTGFAFASVGSTAPTGTTTDSRSGIVSGGTPAFSRCGRSGAGSTESLA